MNKLSHTCGLILFVLLFVNNPFGGLSAQSDAVRIYVESVSAALDETIDVNIRVENFINIGGLQFSLEWNPAELDFVELDNLSLGATPTGSFNQNNISAGMLGYLHADNTLAGFDLNNGDLLFTVRLDPIGPDNAIYDLSFSGTPTSQAVADTTAGSLESVFDDGTITIGMPSEVATLSVQDNRFTISPNPFQSVTRIKIAELGSGRASLAVFTAKGDLVLNRDVELTGQEQYLTLSAADLNTAAGVYLLRLTTDRGSYSRKLIFRGNGR